MNGRYVIALIAPAGQAVCRLGFRRREIALAGFVGAVLLAVLALYVHSLAQASGEVARFGQQRAEQQQRLESIERQAQALQRQNLDSERSIERIERALGAHRTRTAATAARVSLATGHPIGGSDPIAARLNLLVRASASTGAHARRLAGLAKRVLNLRRLTSIARVKMIAAIPSLNPVNGAINAAFGWRTDPFPEFHKGLDLAADYGTTVRAAAAGRVVSAGWDGGFGLKIDLDHGNGYHTWYCHLSHSAVAAGQLIGKGQPIAAVGSTGESTGPHLHYQIMHDGVAIDPLPFLRGVPGNVMATLPLRSDVQ